MLERYWAAPDVPFSESPLVEEVLALLHPDAEWDALHREKPYADYTERGDALEAAGLAQ